MLEISWYEMPTYFFKVYFTSSKGCHFFLEVFSDDPFPHSVTILRMLYYSELVSITTGSMH